MPANSIAATSTLQQHRCHIDVIAGLARDHLFVDWGQGARALALLRAL